MQSFQIQPPAFIKPFLLQVTEPSPAVSQPLERRDARLISSLFFMASVMVLVMIGVAITLRTPIPKYQSLDYLIKLAIVVGGYGLSRTRYYRVGVILGIAAIMTTNYGQTIYAAITAPEHLADSTVWSMAMILIGGLLITWQSMLIVAVVYIAALGALPIIIPGLTIQDVWFSVEFATGMTVLITVTAVLRQRDLNRIKQQAADLTVSESRYRTLLDAGFEAIIIHDNGLILDVNDAVVRMVGFTAAEVIGKRTIDLVTPDARPAVAKLYAEQPSDNLVYETSFTHKDGRRLDAEVRSGTITYQGKDVRVVVFRDITQNKQSSDQIKNLFDSLDRVFYSFSANDGHILQISPACEKLYGYTAQEFYDDLSIWLRLIHPEDLPHFLTDFEHITPDKHEIHNIRIIRKDGEIRWVEILLIPVFNAVNELTRFDGLVTDITERLRIEAEQRELQTEHERAQVLRQFIADASHDLRTPLATMYTSLYLLRRISPQDANLIRHLNTLENQTTHLTRVLDDLFTMSRLDAPATYVEKHRIEVKQITDNVVNAYQQIAANKQLQLHYTAPDSSLFLNADKDYLLDALNRVVKNAVNYTPEGGSVSITVCQKPEKHVTIEVTDTGIGIQPSELPDIFDRFYRSDKARKTDDGGVGLGLSLARKIVELHNGTIEVESTPGEGSTFRITLPLMVK